MATSRKMKDWAKHCLCLRFKTEVQKAQRDASASSSCSISTSGKADATPSVESVVGLFELRLIDLTLVLLKSCSPQGRITITPHHAERNRHSPMWSSEMGLIVSLLVFVYRLHPDPDLHSCCLVFSLLYSVEIKSARSFGSSYALSTVSDQMAC